MEIGLSLVQLSKHLPRYNTSQLIIYKDINGGDLYETRKDKKSWITPTPLSGDINTKYFEGNASLSLDGRTLYFVSDRPGGFGGTDQSQSKTGKEQKPVKSGNADDAAL